MAKAYEELVITDDFMYGKATEDLEIIKMILEMATGRTIDRIERAENQKDIKALIDGKEVRFDSYVEDEAGVVYDSEMQNKNAENTISDPQLPKRSRYYQGMIDINKLEAGARYQELNQSYVIFFCTFDPFGKGLCRYTFENMCKEMQGLNLNDQCTRIFFNSKGRNRDELPLNQRAFLDYMEEGKISDFLTQKIDERVKAVRSNQLMRSSYMKTIMHDLDLRHEVEDECEKKYEKIMAEKDATIAEKDAEILKLKELLANKD